MNKELPRIKLSLLIGLLALMGRYALVQIINDPLLHLAYYADMYGTAWITGNYANSYANMYYDALPVLGLIYTAVGMLLALVFSIKGVAKQKIKIFAGSLAVAAYTGLIFAAQRWLTPLVFNTTTTLEMLLWNLLYYFIFGVVVGYLYLLISKTTLSAPASAYSMSTFADNDAFKYTAPQYESAHLDPKGMESLCTAILNAIRPSLKSPITAVLCSKEEMTIIDLDGEYEIHGYVNSQNTFGAMLATDFTVRARNVVGIWEITNCRVGIKSAKNYARYFTVNYIIISIFVCLAGILGYFILKKLVGF